MFYDKNSITQVRLEFLFSAQQTRSGHGLLIHEVPRSHTTTRHSR